MLDSIHDNTHIKENLKMVIEFQRKIQTIVTEVMKIGVRKNLLVINFHNFGHLKEIPFRKKALLQIFRKFLTYVVLR